MDSSHTVPQRTHTASPELSFQSMSVERHSGFEQRIWDILFRFRPRCSEKKSQRARAFIHAAAAFRRNALVLASRRALFRTAALRFLTALCTVVLLTLVRSIAAGWPRRILSLRGCGNLCRNCRYVGPKRNVFKARFRAAAAQLCSSGVVKTGCRGGVSVINYHTATSATICSAPEDVRAVSKTMMPTRECQKSTAARLALLFFA